MIEDRRVLGKFMIFLLLHGAAIAGAIAVQGITVLNGVVGLVLAYSLLRFTFWPAKNGFVFVAAAFCAPALYGLAFAVVGASYSQPGKITFPGFLRELYVAFSTIEVLRMMMILWGASLVGIFSGMLLRKILIARVS
jgi:hypothetical protein